MSKRRKPDQAPGAAMKPTTATTTNTTTPEGGEPACEPFKPLPKLFTALLIGFALWLGVLLTLYFRTVYPLRHDASGTAATRPGASALPSAPR